MSSEFQYSHPHDIVVVNDNTQVQASPNASNLGTTAIIPFISDKGRDNVFLMIENEAQFLREYGKPNFVKHGQPIYMATQTLRGGGRVAAMRLTASDAAYANLCVELHIKVEEVQKVNTEGLPLYLTPLNEESTEATGNTPIMIKKASIKTIGKKVTGLNNIAQLKTNLEASAGTTDTDGFKIFPLFAVACQGRGSYGNNLAFRISADDFENKRSDYFAYRIETIEGSEIEGPYTFSFFDEAIKNGSSLFLNEIIKKYSSKITTVFSDTGFDGIKTELAPVLTENNLSVEKFNMLFAPTTTVQYLDYSVVDPASVDLDYVNGCKLLEGADGSWGPLYDIENSETMETAFTNFYGGLIDSTILNVLKLQGDYVIDANFPDTVKNAMLQLAIKRKDIQAYFDAGFQTSVTTLVEYRNGTVFDNYHGAIYGQHFSTIDSYTSRTIDVTMTYALAAKLPTHRNTVGEFIPMAGLTYGEISGIVSGSLAPVVNTDEEMNKLYEAQVNYAEEINGSIYLSTQLTTQKILSDFSDANNIALLHKIIKSIRNRVPYWRYSFTTEEDINRFTKDMNDSLETFRTKLAYLEFAISQDEYQRDNKIMETELKIAFKDINERNLIKINIIKNPS